MEPDRIDKSIAQIRLSSMALVLASLVILSISLFFGRGVAQKAATDLDAIIDIQASWPKSIPTHFTTLVSDITIGSDIFIAHMGYVAFHGSSPFSSKLGEAQLFLSSEKHNAIILDASTYQKYALDKLQLLYSSPPLTLEDFQKAWDHLAFPIYFMQFPTLVNWYLGTPDETNIVWWDKIQRDGYTPKVPPQAFPEKSLNFSLSNKESQWDIMGNIWRGEDSSHKMRADINNGDGWFLYVEYEVNAKKFKLLGVLGGPVLKKYSPLKFVPGHEFDLSSIIPFSIAFPWISEYEERFNQASLDQLKQYLSIKEEHEGKQVSLFGISATQKQVVLFALPILLVLQIHILAQIISMIAYFNNRAKNKYIDSEPWLVFSDSKVSFYYYLAVFYLTPLLSALAAVNASMSYSESDHILSISLSLLVFSVSAVLINRSVLLRQLRFNALVDGTPKNSMQSTAETPAD